MGFRYIVIIFGLIFDANSNCEFDSSSVGSIIEDLRTYMQAKWVIFLKHSALDSKYEKGLKYFRKLSTFVYISAYDFKNFQNFIRTHPRSQDVMVVSICPANKKSSDVWFWKEIFTEMKYYYWVMFLPNEVYLNGIFLPFDTSFMTIKVGENQKYEINEVYQTHKSSNIYYSEIGSWDYVQGLQAVSTAFNVRRNNLQAYNLRIYAPREKGNDYFMVVIADVFKEASESIAEKMNATTIFSPTRNKPFDLSLYPMPIIDPKLQSPPLYLFSYNMYYKDEERYFAWDSYLKPFSWSFWIGMIVNGVVSFIGLLVSNYLLNKFQEPPLTQNEKNRSPLYISATLIQATRWFSRIIINSAYSATFISFITFIITVPPFTNLEGILSNGRYNILAIPNKSYEFYEASAQLGNNVVGDLFKKHVLPREQQVHSYTEAFEKICYTDQKFVTDYAVKVINEMIIKMKNCRIRETGIKLLYGSGGWSIPQKSHLRRSLNFWALKLVESGSMNSAIWVRSRIHSKLEIPGGRPIDFEDTATLFVFWFFGVFMSIAVLVLEILKNLQKMNKEFKETELKRSQVRRVTCQIKMERFFSRPSLSGEEFFRN